MKFFHATGHRKAQLDPLRIFTLKFRVRWLTTHAIGGFSLQGQRLIQHPSALLPPLPSFLRPEPHSTTSYLGIRAEHSYIFPFIHLFVVYHNDNNHYLQSIMVVLYNGPQDREVIFGYCKLHLDTQLDYIIIFLPKLFKRNACSIFQILQILSSLRRTQNAFDFLQNERSSDFNLSIIFITQWSQIFPYNTISQIIIVHF